ncbi:MAG: hypothetical protein L0G23_10930, partial [Ruaniaceae bacterium]|nr:hypothetical protein [Ruaniaceae bacterium]
MVEIVRIVTRAASVTRCRSETDGAATDGSEVAAPGAFPLPSGQKNTRVHLRERRCVLHEHGPPASGQSVLA